MRGRESQFRAPPGSVRLFGSALVFLLALAGGIEGGHVFAQPVNLTISGGADRFTIDPGQLRDKITPGDPDYEEKNNIIWGARLDGFYGRNFAFSFGYEKTVFWSSTIDVSATLIMGLFSVRFGYNSGSPDFDFGSFKFAEDSKNFSDNGFIGSFKLENPGYFFLNLDFRMSFANREDSAETSLRQLLGLEGGLWLPHILFRAGYSKRGLTMVVEDPADNTNLLKRNAVETVYSGSLEFFAKSIPFRISLGGGWIVTGWSIKEDEAKDGDRSYAFIEAGVTLNFGSHFSWFLNGEVPFDVDDLPDFTPRHFTATTGIKLMFFNR